MVDSKTEQIEYMFFTVSTKQGKEKEREALMQMCIIYCIWLQEIKQFDINSSLYSFAIM